VRVIVTRPALQAAEWVAQLAAHGVDAAALPLIGIAAIDDAAALVAHWHALAQQRLVVFVSPNAAEQFMAHRPVSARWPSDVQAASPGPGTTRTLIALGVPAAQIIEPAADAAQFDSESLWLQLARHDWRDAGVLIVRGDGGRDWLADTLRGHGARVAQVAAYRRVVPMLGVAERALLQAAVDAPAAHLWLFSSSEAIDNLAALQPLGTATHWAKARAIATHPRIAARARQLGFGQVSEARPALAAVVACIGACIGACIQSAPP
jgi:uroporphyrinogen-III synthase